MTGAKWVMRALATTGKPGQPPLPPQRGEVLLAPGEQFVDIGLMPYVPDNLIPGAIKHPVQGDGKLNNTQIRRQMTPISNHRGYYFVSDLSGQLSEFPLRQSP